MLLWAFVAVPLSAAVVSGGFSLVRCTGFSLWRLLLLWNVSSRAWELQQLWHMGFPDPWHVESSQTRDRTCVPCIGRQWHSHWTTREVLVLVFDKHIITHEVIPHCGFDTNFPDGIFLMLMISDVKHLFIYLLKFLIYFWILTLIRWFVNVFPHSTNCVYTLLIVSFAVQKHFSLM